MSPERLVSRVLSLGGLVSLTVLVGGLVIYVAAAGTGQETNDLYRSLTHEQAGRPAAVYSTLTEIAHGVSRTPPDPLAIIALGSCSSSPPRRRHWWPPWWRSRARGIGTTP